MPSLKYFESWTNMQTLNNIEDQRFSMDSYDDYNTDYASGYIMINDGTAMYSVFFIYDTEIEEELLNAFEEFEDEDFFNLMQHCDKDGVVWVGFEDDDLVVYSDNDADIDDLESIQADNYYNDDINDFISDLKQLEASDIVRLFVFKNTKSGDLFQASPGGLDELYDSLNQLKKLAIA